ncbi:fap1 adhesin [Heterodontus francisci]|uniref:fap1 adhesin n=1 Tax=Heterodontus francisci TaxID=7792 RepID=UPI00355C0376
MSRSAPHSVQSRFGEWSRSLCCCRGEAQSVNSMGGRLSRKKRGYNVNDPKESKTTAESSENPEVKPDEPENSDASKEPVKTTEVELPEEKPETEAPKMASEIPAEKQTGLATPDTKTETATVPALSASTDLAHVSDVQQSVSPQNLLKATKPPDQVEHCLTTEAEVQSSCTDIDLTTKVLDVPVPSGGETQIGAIPDSGSNEEIQEKLVLDKETSVTEDPSTEKSSLCDYATTKIMEDKQLEENSHVNPEDSQVESSEVPERISAMSMHESIVNQERASLQSVLKEKIENSVQEAKSESGCVPPKEAEIPKLSEITPETPTDILKTEMSRCAELEKNIVGPDTQDESQEKVSESLHPTVQVVADVKTEPFAEHSLESPNYMRENINVEAHSQLMEGSGNLSVDTSRENSVPESVTDVFPAESKDPVAECTPETGGAPENGHVVSAESNDPLVAESAPETFSNAEKEVTETNCEQTPEMISHKDHAEEISLLKTSSELIPDIKLTVYTETSQEKIEINTELPTKGSEDDGTLPEESLVSDSTNSHPLVEKQSTTCSVEMVLEKVSSDKEMDDALKDPLPESKSSPNVSAEVIKTEETSSPKTENGVPVDGEKSLNESTSKTKEDNEVSGTVANGTSVDEVRDHSKSTSKAEVNGQNETEADGLQGSTSDLVIQQ